jgi:hypothetical protein
MPSLFNDRSSWPTAPAVDVDGNASWLAEAAGHDIAFVPSTGGDLIAWDWRLPHSNPENLSARPRLAQAVASQARLVRDGKMMPTVLPRPVGDHPPRQVSRDTEEP